MNPDFSPKTQDKTHTPLFPGKPALHTPEEPGTTGKTRAAMAACLSELTRPTRRANPLLPMVVKWNGGGGSISRATAEKRVRLVKRWAEWLAGERHRTWWDEVKGEEARAYLAGVGAAHGANLRNTTLCAIRLFLRWATGGGAAEPSEPKRGATLTPDDLTRSLTPAECEQLCAAGGPVEMRLAVLLGYKSGCRAGETASLEIGSINALKSTAAITGKGGRQRIIHLSADTMQLIAVWLKSGRRKHATPHSPQTLLLTRDGIALQNDTVNQWVQAQAHRAGLTRHITSHMLRHSFATRLLEARVEFEIILRLLGHANSAITRRYTHLSPEFLRAAVEKAHDGWKKQPAARCIIPAPNGAAKLDAAAQSGFPLANASPTPPPQPLRCDASEAAARPEESP